MTTSMLVIAISMSGCCPNEPPEAVADLEPPQSTRTEWRLDASKSSDPEGEVLTFNWEQASGPPLRIVGGQTDAQLVVAWDTPCIAYSASFLVTVSDGIKTATSEVTLEYGGLHPEFGVSAGVDMEVFSGDRVSLTGAINNPNGLTISHFWQQDSGSEVAVSPSTDVLAITFIAPEVTSATDFQFTLTGTESICNSSVTDTVVIHVLPRYPLQVHWKNAPDPVNAAINWYLPSGASVAVNGSEWGLSGSKYSYLDQALIPDGLHWFPFTLNGSAVTADVGYALDIRDYRFSISGRLVSGSYRGVALDVMDGQSKVLFNGWLAGTESESGGVTGRYPVEGIAAWRNASPDLVAVELNITRPTGDQFPAFRQAYAPQGFERVSVAPDVTIPDGLYRIDYWMFGPGNSADISLDTSLLNYRFTRNERMLGDARRVIGIDVHEGVARPVYNGWLDSNEMVGELTPARPLQAVCGFQATGEPVAVDLNVILPDQSYLPVNRSEYDLQNFEAIGVDSGVTVADGLYRFQVFVYGAGLSADVAFSASLLNWSSSRIQRVLGYTELYVDVLVTSGVAIEIGSNW